MNQEAFTHSDPHGLPSSTNASDTDAEIDALRQRVALLEQNLLGRRSQGSRFTRRNSRMVRVVILLVAVAAVGGGLSFIVRSQNPDPITVDRNGNVGIKTPTPNATLDVNGVFQAQSATIRGDVSLATVRFPDGTAQTSAAPPRGAVIAFNLSSCPGGWSEYAPARGRFIRGIDTTGGNNIDPDGRRAPGSTQEDAIRNMKGKISGVAGASNRAWPWGFRPGTDGVFVVPYGIPQYNPYGGGEYRPDGGVGFEASFDASRQVPTAADNRPRNVALLYCQKN